MNDKPPFGMLAVNLLGDKCTPDDWQHEIKLQNLTEALEHMYTLGCDHTKTKAASMVSACTERDPTLRKVASAIMDLD